MNAYRPGIELSHDTGGGGVFLFFVRTTLSFLTWISLAVRVCLLTASWK